MRFKKKHVCDLKHCYTAVHMTLEGKEKVLFAPDDYGPCIAFDLETGEAEEILDNLGGTTSMVQVPGSNGFLAIQGFNPTFDAADAKLVYVYKERDKWTIQIVQDLPYVHRIDILTRGGVFYLVCCTLCSSKKYEQDWSSPGFIHVAILPSNFSNPIQFERIPVEMTRHHGYVRLQGEDFTYGLSSSDQGVFEIIPPEKLGAEWSYNKILDVPVSDVAVCDIDSDGIDELATLEPFHGETIRIYKKVDGKYIPIYTYHETVTFSHVIWGGKLQGVPTFIFGGRADKKRLFLIRYSDNEFIEKEIESGFGPSNIEVIQHHNKEIIAVANREKNEGALLIVE